MSAKKGPTIQEDITPNLIPMIDIMFLLLLFLMIASDMGQRELEDVILPKATVVVEDKPDQDKEKEERLTINIHHVLPQKTSCKAYDEGGICREDAHWRLGIKGTDFTDMKVFNAHLEKAAAPSRKEPGKSKKSERKVMIRADGSAPFGMPQKAINECANVGMYKIDVGAAKPAEEKKRPAAAH
jgi:biopolymer transport protein ExbD